MRASLILIGLVAFVASFTVGWNLFSYLSRPPTADPPNEFWSNALKYSHDRTGGGLVEVTFTPPPNIDYFTLYFADRGQEFYIADFDANSDDMSGPVTTNRITELISRMWIPPSSGSTVVAYRKGVKVPLYEIRFKAKTQ